MIMVTCLNLEIYQKNPLKTIYFKFCLFKVFWNSEKIRILRRVSTYSVFFRQIGTKNAFGGVNFGHMFF